VTCAPPRNAFSAVRALFEGQRGFYKLRMPPPYLVAGGGPAATSYYDTEPLKETLERLVDFRSHQFARGGGFRWARSISRPETSSISTTPTAC